MSHILILDITDHLPISTSIPYSNTYSNHPLTVSTAYNYTRNNLDRLHEHLGSTDWSSTYNTDDPSLAYGNFMNTFKLIHNADIPLITNKRNRKKIPKSLWITDSLLCSINLKNKLYRKSLASRNADNHHAYIIYKNILTKVLRTAKKNYYHIQFEKEKNNIKNTWKIINSVINKKSSQKISRLSHNGKLIKDSLVIPELFNSYFANVGPNLARSIPSCINKFSDYLSDPNSHSLFFNPVTDQEVCDVVKNLANKKSSGFDSSKKVFLLSLPPLNTSSICLFPLEWFLMT